MIELNIATNELFKVEFDTLEQLKVFLRVLKIIDTVWLATDDCENGEVLVSDNMESIISLLKMSKGGYVRKGDSFKFYVQMYPSFEEAYEVALSMKESNKKCYK